MVPLGDEAQVESCFSPFRDSVNLDVRYVHSLLRMYNRLGHRFGRTRWNSLVTWVMGNLNSFRLETVLVSEQDRCMVHARHTIGLEIILDAPDGTTR